MRAGSTPRPRPLARRRHARQARPRGRAKRAHLHDAAHLRGRHPPGGCTDGGRTGISLALESLGTPMRNARRAPLLALLLTALTTAPAAAQSRDLDSYLLFALEGMRTKGLSISSGNLGVNDPNGAI